MQNQKVIKLAEEIMHNFDTIISLFDMCFVFISKESSKISGYKPEEMIGKHIYNFMPIDRKSEKFKKIILSTMSGRTTIPIKTKSGKIMEIPMDFIIIKVNGESFLVTKAVNKKGKKYK